MTNPFNPSIEPPELTAGGYLRLRREAEGFSIDDLALLYARTITARTAAAVMLETAFARLSQMMRLNAGTYFALVDHLPLAPLCRACGTSWAEPCGRGEGAVCAWVQAA